MQIEFFNILIFKAIARMSFLDSDMLNNGIWPLHISDEQVEGEELSAS